MSASAWEKLGFAALAATTFICTLIVIRGAVNFVTWSTLDAAWAGALGTFVAILGTWATTRHQLVAAERLRLNERAKSESEMSEIAYQLTHDAFLAVLSIHLKFDDAQAKKKHKAIGTERLEDIQASLRNFAAKDIPPYLLTEILVVQKEVAYTLTAVHQHQSGMRVDDERVRKSKRRLQPILDSALRIR